MVSDLLRRDLLSDILLCLHYISTQFGYPQEEMMGQQICWLQLIPCSTGKFGLCIFARFTDVFRGARKPVVTDRLISPLV